jgi:hypothetical protein
MGDPAKRRATYEDLLAVPKHLVAERVGGRRPLRPSSGRPEPGPKRYDRSDTSRRLDWCEPVVAKYSFRADFRGWVTSDA